MTNQPQIKSTEVTTTNIYKKALPRFNMTKYQTGQKSSMDLINFLLDFYHDNQLKK